MSPSGQVCNSPTMGLIVRLIWKQSWSIINTSAKGQTIDTNENGELTCTMYQSFSSVFITNKTVSVAREHH